MFKNQKNSFFRVDIFRLEPGTVLAIRSKEKSVFLYNDFEIPEKELTITDKGTIKILNSQHGNDFTLALQHSVSIVAAFPLLVLITIQVSSRIGTQA